MYSFIIDMRPFGKERHKINKKTLAVYSPQSNREYEKAVGYICKASMAKNGIFCASEKYVEVHIVAFFKIPAGTNKIKEQRMLSGELMPDKKPDIDNIAKAVMDGMNGIAYQDDKQVIKLIIEKRYGREAKVEVAVREYEKDLKGD